MKEIEDERRRRDKNAGEGRGREKKDGSRKETNAHRKNN